MYYFSTITFYTGNKELIQNAYVSLGSNLGDRAGNLLLGVRAMMDAGLEVLRLSRVYETEAVETFAQPLFLNQVAELRGKTLPSAETLMARLLRIEYALGRRREVARSPRSIDLDLLLYPNLTSDSPFLTLPHPRLHRRRFVLEPLAELAPQLIHPVLNKTINQLMAELEDVSTVHLWKPDP